MRWGGGGTAGVCIIFFKGNIAVINDAAEAFMATYKGKKIGSFGDIKCLLQLFI